MLDDVVKTPGKYVNWKVENGILYRFRRYPLDPIAHREENWRLVVPIEYQEEVLRKAHCLHLSEHLGIEKTYDCVAREYYWRGMYYDVTTFVRTWRTCQTFKVLQTGAQGLMGT